MPEQNNSTPIEQNQDSLKEETAFPAGTESSPPQGENPASSSKSPSNSSYPPIKTKPAEKDDVKWMAALSYLPLICLIPLFLSRDDEFIQKHAKQGFVLFIVELVAMLLKIDAIWNLIIFICFATAIVGALGILLKGEIRIPLLADFAEKLNI